MARKFLLGIALAVLAALTAAFYSMWPRPLPPTPAAIATPASTAAPVAAAATAGKATTTSPTAAAVPATSAVEEAPRPNAGYDRYREELERIRAARRDAQALKANERCINGQRYRKTGTEWEQAGSC